MEWSRNEDHIRREFLVDVRIETVIMTKNSAGKPTGKGGRSGQIQSVNVQGVPEKCPTITTNGIFYGTPGRQARE